MENSRTKSERLLAFVTWKSIAEYSFVAFSNFLFTYFILGLWNAYFSAPFRRGGDADFHPIMVRTIEQTGWIFSNAQLGTPKSLTMYDVPQGGDNLNWIILKALSTFVTATQAVNIHYVLSFVIVAVAAYGAAKWWGLSRPVAFIVAHLYAFLPYHFFRNVSHQLLTVYAVIPIILVYCYFQVTTGYKLSKIKVVVLAVATASLGAYYAIFSCMLLVTAILWNLTAKNIKRVKETAVVLISICIVFIFNLLPTIIYRLSNGPNDNIVARSRQDAENFGLQISNMIAPRQDHRIEAFAKIGSFIHGIGTVSETGQALGVIVTLGFFGMLGYAIYCAVTSREIDQRFKYFTMLSILIMVFAVSSGFATFVSSAGITQIRAWNRVVVIIAFIGLLAAGTVIEHIADVLKKRQKYMGYAFLVFVLLFGLWDQTSTHDRIANDIHAARFRSDCDFVQKIEEAKPQHQRVLQVPFMGFPEFPDLNGLTHYDQGMLILCDTDLKFSFGAMSGRDDTFQKKISQDNIITDEEIEKLRAKEFSVLEIDRLGYTDRGAEIESRLTQRFGDPIVSADETRSAFIIDNN